MIISYKDERAVPKAAIRKGIKDCHHIAIYDTLPVLYGADRLLVCETIAYMDVSEV